MAEHKTTIAGYSVEATTGYADDSGTNGCWITYKTRAGHEYSASLAALEDTGVLEDQSGAAHAVKPEVVDQIKAWSAGKGY